MSRYVRKLIPFLSCDIPAIENWLRDMAKKGLFYKESGMLFAKFERGEPKECCYKLEYENIVTGRIPPDKQAMYEEFGWTVLDDIRTGMVVVCADDEDFKNDDEITIDKISALEQIQKKHQRLGIMYVVLWLLSLNPIPIIKLLFGSEKVDIHDFLVMGTGKYVLAVAVGFLLLLEGIYRLIHSNRMKKYVEWLKGKGELPEKKPNTFVCAVMSAISVPLVLLWILALMFGYQLFSTHLGESVYELGEYDFPLINEINAEEWQRVLDIHSNEASEPLLVLFKKSDLLTNDMYEIWQDDMSGDDEGSLDYHVSYYDMKKEKHAVMLMDELAEICSDNDITADTRHKEKEYEKDGCQIKYYKKVYKDYNNNDTEWQGLLILYNNEIVDVAYYGESDLSDYVDLYISYLKK